MVTNKIKILIAEDEYIIAIDLKKTLEKLGYVITAYVANGQEVIRHAQTDNPDLIIMDIMLEGEMSGIQAAEIIKQKYNVPIVYLTAFTDEKTLQRAKITEPVGYILKPFEERSLHSAIEIALYKHEMETQLKIKTTELEDEKNKTDELLHHILPDEIIKELKAKGIVNPRHFPDISILFTNFPGFTGIMNTLPPGELVEELNDIFSSFDDIIESHGLEKLKTLGDTYMIGSGFPMESKDHAVKIVLAALDMMQFIDKRNRDSKISWKLRAGINSGEVVAGVVGTNKFTYDVWGDTVNIASRMESTSLPDKINISGSTYELVKDYFDCQYRGKLNVKGKGDVDMYFVIGKKDGWEKLELSDWNKTTPL